MRNSEKHLAARALAEAGVPVIRLEENGKRPTTLHGLKDRTTDLSVIDGWYDAGDWNFGYCPGDLGQFAVDFDGVDPILGPPTRLHRTPSGYHALYIGDCPPSAKKLPGIDVRGRESYIVAPGSTIDGVPYKIIDPQPVAEAPEWMLDLFSKPNFEQLPERVYEQDGFAALAAAYRYANLLIRNGDIPSPGNRNDHATRFFLQLHGYGLSAEMAVHVFEEFLIRSGGARPDPDDDKIKSLVHRIWSGVTGTNPAGSELPREGSEILKEANIGDDGGPRLLNGENLDNRNLSTHWQVYDMGKMPEPANVPMLAGEWIEKYVFDYHEGGGGIGKSYIAQQEAVCIQAGIDVLGYTSEKTSVFYLNYEEPKDEFERRLYRIATDGRLDPRKDPKENPIDLSGFHAQHLRQETGAHILRVTRTGQIIITRFGRSLLDTLSKQRDKGQHSFVVFDGLMDAVLFEGSTRSEDDVARQVIALLDRWCIEYDMTGRGIIHPSRAGERTGGESYAPAWTTKPRARQTYQRVTYGGKGAKVTDYLPPQAVFTRRTITKRSHGIPGKYVDLQYQNGLFLPLSEGGGQEPMEVAVAIAKRQAAIGARIKRNGAIGTDSKLSNKHAIIVEYRHRTGKDHGVEHFLGVLDQAEKEDRLLYQEGGHNPNKLAGYYSP